MVITLEANEFLVTAVLALVRPGIPKLRGVLILKSSSLGLFTYSFNTEHHL